MKYHFYKYHKLIYIFIFILKISIIISEDENRTIRVPQTILDQATYFETSDSDIYQSFIDFELLKLYNINMTKIYSNGNPTFEFYFNGSKLNIRCKQDEKRIKCAEIYLNEHDCRSFDYDFYIAYLGGIFAFLFVLIGFISLLKGYIYYYLVTSFYSGFGFLLFCREFCELMEIMGKLNADDPTSEKMLIAFYVISIISCFAYGYASFLSKYLRYIAFGLIDGLLLGKYLFYYIVRGLETDIALKYFFAELICCIFFISYWIIFQNKYQKITMANISIMASYSILYGFNLLIGGLPFIPFLILAKAYQKIDKREKLFERLINKNYSLHYGIFFLLFVIGGTYFNIKNYDIHMKKAKKKISVY